MSYAGNAMLNDIWTRYQRKIFYGGYKAVKMTQLGSGQDTLWITEAQNKSGSKIIFKSRHVIMATGAE